MQRRLSHLPGKYKAIVNKVCLQHLCLPTQAGVKPFTISQVDVAITVLLERKLQFHVSDLAWATFFRCQTFTSSFNKCDLHHRWLLDYWWIRINPNMEISKAREMHLPRLNICIRKSNTTKTVNSFHRPSRPWEICISIPAARCKFKFSPSLVHFGRTWSLWTLWYDLTLLRQYSIVMCIVYSGFGFNLEIVVSFCEFCLFFGFRGKGSTLWTLKCRFPGRHSTLRSLKCKLCGRSSTLWTSRRRRRSTLWTLKCRFRGRRSTLWTLKCRFRGRCSTLWTLKCKFRGRCVNLEVQIERDR